MCELTSFASLLENRRYGEASQVLTASSGTSSRLIELRAQLLAVTAWKQEAFRLMRKFTAAHPDRARAMEALASLDASAGRQRPARGLLELPARLEPENEDVAEAIAGLTANSRRAYRRRPRTARFRGL